MKHSLTRLSFAFFAVAAILAAYFVLLYINPNLLPAKAPDPNAPMSQAQVTYEETPVGDGAIIAGSLRRFVVTLIEISYTKQIHEDKQPSTSRRSSGIYYPDKA
jgi:hypothetical protein